MEKTSMLSMGKTQPKESVSETRKPQREKSYAKDISPFSNGIGISLALVAIGAVASIIVYLDESIPVIVIAFTLGLAFYGLGKVSVLAYSAREFFADKETIEIHKESYEADPQDFESNVYWVKIDNSDLRLPPEPGRGALQEFCKAIMSEQASFSELGGTNTKGAKDFGYSNQKYAELRDWFLKQNLAVWKSEEFPQQGVRLTERGKKTIAAIANSGIESADKFI